jgi:hypothetical protein
VSDERRMRRVMGAEQFEENGKYNPIKEVKVEGAKMDL